MWHTFYTIQDVTGAGVVMLLLITATVVCIAFPAAILLEATLERFKRCQLLQMTKTKK